MGNKEDVKERVYNIKDPSDEVTKIVDTLKVAAGMSRPLYVYETEEVGIARVGIADKSLIVLVNPKKLQWGNKDTCGNFAILAHELGHIINSHMTLDKIWTDEELQADFYAGFASRKFCPNLNTATKPFEGLSELDPHGTFARRSEEIKRGRADAEKFWSFTPPKASGPALHADESPVGFDITVKKRLPEELKNNRPDLKYRVIFSIKPKDFKVNPDSMAKAIEKVRYKLHWTMRKSGIPLLPTWSTVYNTGNKNPLFKKSILVHGNFPTKATIFYKNGRKETAKNFFDVNQ